MPDQTVEFERDEFTVSTDPARLDVEDALALLRETHWGGEMARETLARAVAHSLTFGVYHGERLVGLARAVTDLTTFAYLTDVVIAEEYRGRGLGRWLIECILAHPDLQRLRRVALLTRDAQGLYERLGFTTDTGHNTYLERREG